MNNEQVSLHPCLFNSYSIREEYICPILYKTTIVYAWAFLIELIISTTDICVNSTIKNYPIMNNETRRKAWKKVKSIKRFYIHASIFVIMGIFFFFMNMVTSPFDMWFFFPMIPWGTLLAFHYLFVFGIPGTGLLSREWEEREFEKQMDRLDGDVNYHSPLGRKGSYLPYTELSEEDALELRKMQKESDKFFNEDFV